MNNKATNNKTKQEWVAWLKWFGKKKNRYTLSSEENLALRDAIIAYEAVAEEFFFHTMNPMNLGFENKIHKTYNVHVLVEDIATWVYIAMFNEGKWTRLNSFAGNCSLFSWVSVAASQSVYKELRDEHIIPSYTEPSHKNTSLTLRSMKYEDEVMLVLDLVEDYTMRQLLSSLYVDKLTEEDAMKTLGMSEELFVATRKTAEIILKEALISEDTLLVTREDGKTVNLVSLALSDVSNELNTSSSEGAIAFAETIQEEFDGDDYTKDVLNELYPDKPWREQWMSFVLDRANEMDWSEEDNIVFIERFYNESSPVLLAKRLGRARTWIDNKYSRELKALAKHITLWWEKNAK